MSEADFSQFEAFAKSWQAVDKEFEDFLRKFLLEMALRAVAQIKKRQAGKLGGPPAVDTGAMLNTWGIGNQSMQVGRHTGEALSAFEQAATIESVEVVGDTLEITIWNLMDYASFVEFGHRTTGGNWVEGRFMMTISIDEVQRQIPARFETALKAYLQSKGAV